MKGIGERFLYQIYTNNKYEVRAFILKGIVNYNNECYYIATDLTEGDLMAFRCNENTKELFGATKNIEIINEWYIQNGEEF